MIYTFRTIIEPDQPNSYHDFIPLLPGIHTCGKAIEEVKQNLKEATICHLQGLIKDHQPIPLEEAALESVQNFSDKELALN